MKNINKYKFLQYCGWLGIFGVIFYFLHVIIGNFLYKGYSPVTQAISDLTANGAPSKVAASIFSILYGIFTTLFALAFYIFFRKKINHIFSLGALFFFIMNLVSAVGYAIFPLSEVGFANTFQDTMHVVVTAIVVAFSIAALVLFAIGFIKHGKQKWLGYAAIATLCLMMTGSILLGAAPAILGIGERINIYALQIYTILLAVFLIRYKNNSKEL